jgi:hypothetical protein
VRLEGSVALLLSRLVLVVAATMLVHHRPILERRPSWLSAGRSSSRGRESAKPGATVIPELEETESSSSSGASCEESSSSSTSLSNEEDALEEVIDVDAALGTLSTDHQVGKREWIVPRTLSWTPVKVVQPPTPEQRHSMGRSKLSGGNRIRKKKSVGTPLVVSTQRLTAIPESSPSSSTPSSQGQEQQQNEPYEDLVRRVEALELGAAYKATKEEVEKVEVEFLMKLRAIREAMAAGSASAGNGSTVDMKTSSKELEALKAENEELKRRNSKLEYRVQHVVGEMSRLYDQVAELKMNTEDTSMAEF